ncbi:uncharacterized protein LOC130641552 isoform X3 [Hydractinia symbiolongicarpus]|uniref:uncharacterized protein LOC130641552 isoform X3 n=1 Tax=Hydractinia symbiolongicarpus TaxID=13093 RepID=UPI00254E6D57|nr:uncharacterized protein LOC130641552 isoform X3 [Hydractinia symbiolongicarpus]
MDMQSNEDTGKNIINGHLQNTQLGKDKTVQLEKDFNNCSSRSLDRRSSIENFGLIGLLTPLLALVPHVNGRDALTTTLTKLKGENSSLKLAAAHIEDALAGRGRFGKARAYFKPFLPQKCFYIYSNIWYTRLILVVIVLHSLLIFFEPPSKQILSVGACVYILNAFCLFVFTIDIVIHVTFLSWPIFWSKKAEESYWNGVQFVLVCMFLADFLLLAVGYFVHEVLLNILTRMLKMLVIILAFIVVFACIGIHQYMEVYNEVYHQEENTQNSTLCCVDKEEENPYIGAFDHIVIAMLRLLVLLSTENYPTFMLPAFRHNQANFFFFGTFVFVGVFFLTAILLAIIVDSYWLDAKKHVKKNRAKERAELAKAWNLIDPCGYGAVDTYDKTFLTLFRKLKPKNSDEQNQFLIGLLDSNQDGYIDSFEWTTLLRQALEAEFEENNDEFRINRTKDLNSYENIQEKAKAIIESEVFSRSILILIFLHVCLFTMKWKGQNEITALVVQGFRSFIVLLFMMESLLKIIGFRKSLFKQLELLDVTLVLLATIFNILCYAYLGTSTYNLFTVLSSLCIFMRLFLNSAKTRYALRWFLNIAPVMIDLMVLLIISIYLLAVIGMELFQGYPVPTNTKDNVYFNFCGIGFDTFACSLLMLFQMLSTSNWHDVMNMVHKSTGRGWTVAYFVSVYIVITMVIMNLFVAIAIEAANKLGRSTNDFQQQKHEAKYQKKSLKKKAATVLHTFANSFFGTARTEDISQRNELTQAMTGVKRKRVSTAFIVRQPNSASKKKISVVQFQNPVLATLQDEQYQEKIKEETHSVASEVDLEGVPKLTAQEKRKQNIINRMKKRKKQHKKRRVEEEIEIVKEVEQEKKEAELNRSIARANTKAQCRVVAAFKATHARQLGVNVGDTVNILEDVDDWIHGELDGRIGWIPASHVIIMRKQESSLTSLNRNPIIIPSFDLPPKELTRQLSNYSDTPYNSNPKHRIKLKRAGDWTRDILGDITVMNAEEMRELNKVMRADIRAPSYRRKVPTKEQRDYSAVFEETVFSETASKNHWQPVQLAEKRHGESSSSLDGKEKFSNLQLKVSVDPVATPSPPDSPIRKEDTVERLRPSNLPKLPVKLNKSSTPPEWIKKFALSNNVLIDNDAKIGEPNNPEHRPSSYSSVTSVALASVSKERDSVSIQAQVSLKRKRNSATRRSVLANACNLRKRSSPTVSPEKEAREESSTVERSSVDVSCEQRACNDVQLTAKIWGDLSTLKMPPTNNAMKEEEMRRILVSKQYEQQNVNNVTADSQNITILSVTSNDLV